MKLSTLLFTTVLAALSTTHTASAHIGFSGDRNFDTLVQGVTETASSRTLSSSFGWADGSDSTWGDSHRNTYFRFSLTGSTTVSISVQRNDLGGQTGATGTLLPAFTLYRIGTGTMPGGTHDSAVASVNFLTTTFGTGGVAEAFTDTNSNTLWNVGESFTDTNGNGSWDSAGLGNSGKEGSFNALGDWQIYSDAPASALGDFRYVGHVADGSSANYGLASGISGDGVADGLVSLTFAGLGDGEYFIVVGGANYFAQNAETATFGPSSNAYPTYGIAVSVTAIPEPSTTAALAGVGVLGLATLRRRRAA